MSAVIFDIITIFPAFFQGPFSHGMVHQAQKRGLIEVNLHDLRDYAFDRHKTVDDRPFGGGEGMVLKPEPLFGVIRQLREHRQHLSGKVILLTPQGKRFSQRMACQYSTFKNVVLICGRYEGVDERVIDCLVDDEVSIGDFVLSGGELAACVLVDAVTRLLPGVLNNRSDRCWSSAARLSTVHPTERFRGIESSECLDLRRPSEDSALAEEKSFRKDFEKSSRLNRIRGLVGAG
jgi:tRNA (guanine37-N1)-methyltransferase